MTFDSISIADRDGPHASSCFNHEMYNILNPQQNKNTKPQVTNLHKVRYNPQLGSDDEHTTDEETDRSSQSSSDDYFSQTSDSTIAASPLNDASNELGLRQLTQHTVTKIHSDAWRSHRTEREAAQPASGDCRLKSDRPLSNDTEPQFEAPTARAHAHGVPFRPKPVEASPSAVQRPSALQIDTSRVATDVQLSRMRPQERTSEEYFPARRRGRSVCRPCPPKLRRDTDQTDAIVKMIVLFCTNLINSIWTNGTTSESTTTQPSGSNVLPLQVFITETLRRSKTSYSTLQIALYYLILLKQCLPPFASASQPAQGCRAMQCGRRMFLTALILASKYLQDRNYSARAWSKISGLPLKEINDNERRYLSIVCWDLHVPKDTFENWSKIVLNVCRLSMDPEACGRDVDSQPPPGAGPSGQKCLLKNMCQESLSALRSWWLSNLKCLCTEIVKCPRKTDKYVSSIAPFRDTSYLPRPIIESSWQDKLSDTAVTDQSKPTRALPRLPSIDSISKRFLATEQANSPAMPPKLPVPRMLANLPTPQQTPYATDMASMWTPQMGKPNLRCRVSASALSNLDQRRCPMANLATCPPPKPKPQSRSSWAEIELAPQRNVPDRSLTSSPESVISEAPSAFSFAPRSRSSSISSTSSWLTSTSSSGILAEKQRAERLSRPLHEAQQQYTQQFVQQLAESRQHSLTAKLAMHAVEHTGRPRTAFKAPHQLQMDGQPAALAETFVDEGYGSDDYAKVQRERQQRENAAQVLAALQRHSNSRADSLRSSLSRHSTQVFESSQPASTNSQVLKRSRSESLDLSSEKGWCFKLQQNHLCTQKPSDQTTDGNLNYCPVADLIKAMVPTTHPYLPPRMPVQDGVHNKRIALETSCPAATLASMHLQKDILLQG